ncbi:hypothetical protein L7F22_010009 [Adiantum nelumboides]|nr:hypothetical protein [Adiantum nelumboides]
MEVKDDSGSSGWKSQANGDAMLQRDIAMEEGEGSGTNHIQAGNLTRFEYPKLARFCQTQEEFAEVHGLSQSGKLWKHLSAGDLPVSKWLTVFDTPKYKGSKIFLNMVKPQFVDECRLLFYRVYQEPPINNEIYLKFATCFVYKKCSAAKADPEAHKIAWALFAEHVILSLKRNPVAWKRKVDAFRDTHGPINVIPTGWSDAEAAHHMSFETGRGYTENVVGVEEGSVFYLGIASPGGAEKSWSDRKAAKNVGHDTVPRESIVLGATSEDIETVLGGETNAESVFLAKFVKRFKSNKRTTTTTAPGEDKRKPCVHPEEAIIMELPEVVPSTIQTNQTPGRLALLVDLNGVLVHTFCPHLKEQSPDLDSNDHSVVKEQYNTIYVRKDTTRFLAWASQIADVYI